ncbi:MAG: helix-turn-helix transcriptional regulator [bacterium]
MAIRLSTAIDRRKRIRRAAQHIESTLHHNPSARLTVEKVANVACMSPSHFIRRYAHAVGESPDASVRRLRLQLARDMLATDPRPSVTQVAFTVGYENVAAFGRAYRRQFGTAPSDDSACSVSPVAVTTRVVERRGRAARRATAIPSR